jgi:hypothetical protein
MYKDLEDQYFLNLKEKQDKQKQKLADKCKREQTKLESNYLLPEEWFIWSCNSDFTINVFPNW